MACDEEALPPLIEDPQKVVPQDPLLSILDLPNELLYIVGLLIDVPDIPSWALTCKRFFENMDAETIYKRKCFTLWPHLFTLQHNPFFATDASANYSYSSSILSGISQSKPSILSLSSSATLPTSKLSPFTWKERYLLAQRHPSRLRSPRDEQQEERRRRGPTPYFFPLGWASRTPGSVTSTSDDEDDSTSDGISTPREEKEEDGEGEGEGDTVSSSASFTVSMPVTFQSLTSSEPEDNTTTSTTTTTTTTMTTSADDEAVGAPPIPLTPDTDTVTLWTDVMPPPTHPRSEKEEPQGKQKEVINKAEEEPAVMTEVDSGTGLIHTNIGGYSNLIASDPFLTTNVELLKKLVPSVDPSEVLFKGLEYFEIKLLKNTVAWNKATCIAVSEFFEDGGMTFLGWNDMSVAYHSDDGTIQGQGRLLAEDRFDTFTTGDTVGCGIDWTRNHVFFTKNGRYTGHKRGPVRVDRNWYPAVGSMCMGDRVRMNFGAEPFVFDLNTYLDFATNEEHKSAQAENNDSGLEES